MFIALPYTVSIRDYRYRGCCGDMSSGFEQWKTAVKNSVMSKTSVLPMHCSVLYSFRLARLKRMRLSAPPHRTQHDNHHSAERACVGWCKYSLPECSMLMFTRLCQCGVCVWTGRRTHNRHQTRVLTPSDPTWGPYLHRRRTLHHHHSTTDKMRVAVARRAGARARNHRELEVPSVALRNGTHLSVF